MISIKTEEETNIMRACGEKLKKVTSILFSKIQTGISTFEINDEAIKLLQEEGVEPSFTKVPKYKWAVCVPINSQVVHTPPSKRILKKGDVLTVDIGAFYKGFHTDFAITIEVGVKTDPVSRFLNAGKSALQKAIDISCEGNRIYDISNVIQNEIEKSGFAPIKELTGHGVGRKLHEDPFIPGIAHGKREKSPEILSGMTFAIEVIYAMKDPTIVYEDDGWSIETADKSLTACFEHTIIVTKSGPEVIT